MQSNFVISNRNLDFPLDKGADVRSSPARQGQGLRGI